VVLDFGGGTFDCTLAVQSEGRLSPIAAHGDELLGGDDFDTALADAVADLIFRQEKVDLRRDAVRMAELRWRCESAKRQLSDRKEARVHMREAYARGGAYHDVDVLVDRAWIEPRWQPLVDRALAAVQEMLAAGQLRPVDVDEVLLIGGTGRVPLVQRAFASYFGKPLTTSPDSGLAVVTGAAIVAGGLAA
jgi:molecular chaperone DnaK